MYWRVVGAGGAASATAGVGWVIVDILLRDYCQPF
jgi:hypothetical protein